MENNMEQNNSGENMIYMANEMVQGAIDALTKSMEGDFAPVPGTEGNLVLVRVNSPEYEKRMGQRNMVFPVTGTKDFCLFTEVKN